MRRGPYTECFSLQVNELPPQATLRHRPRQLSTVNYECDFCFKRRAENGQNARYLRKFQSTLFQKIFFIQISAEEMALNSEEFMPIQC